MGKGREKRVFIEPSGSLAHCRSATSPIFMGPPDFGTPHSLFYAVERGRCPKNHNVSHCDILLSLDLIFKEQEGAGPPFILFVKQGGTLCLNQGRRDAAPALQYKRQGLRDPKAGKAAVRGKHYIHPHPVNPYTSYRRRPRLTIPYRMR